MGKHENLDQGCILGVSSVPPITPGPMGNLRGPPWYPNFPQGPLFPLWGLLRTRKTLYRYTFKSPFRRLLGIPLGKSWELFGNALSVPSLDRLSVYNSLWRVVSDWVSLASGWVSHSTYSYTSPSFPSSYIPTFPFI